MKATIQIKNFKQLEDVTIEIKSLTLLFGPNGSGKSTFIKALTFLGENIKNFEPGKINEAHYEFNGIDLDSYNDIVTNNETEREIEFIYNLELTWEEYWKDFADKKPKIVAFDPDEEYEVEEKEEEFVEMKNYNELESLFSSDEPYKKLKILQNDDEDIKAKLHVKFNNNGIVSFEITDLLADTLIKFTSVEEEVQPIIRTENNLFSDLVNILDGDIWSQIFYLPSLKPMSNDTFFNKIPKKVHNILKTKKSADFLEIKNELLKILSLMYKLYVLFPQLAEKVFDVAHIGAIREIPQNKYLLKNNKFPNIPLYPLNRYLSEEEYSKFDEYIKNERNQRNSFEFNYDYEHWAKLIISYLRKMKLANGIYTKKENNIGRIIVEKINKSVVGLSQASSGLLQVLPILTLLGEIGFAEDETIPQKIMIEQPELHLHPKVQADLADIFTEVVSLNKDPFLDRNFKYIIETHSEHITRKFQILFAQGKITDKDINIYYFDNKTDTTKIKKMEMEKNGFFKEPWPDGFFDERSKLTKELLYAEDN